MFQRKKREAEAKIPNESSAGGEVFGTGPEYYRYMHAMGTKPSETAKEISLHLADEIRCGVCGTILKGILADVKFPAIEHED